MNKYENAIDVVARYCSDYRTGIFPPRNEVYRELDILNELVDKVLLVEQALDKACYFLEKSKFGTTCDEEHHKNCTENHCSTYCMHSRKMNKEECKKYLMGL